MKNFTSQSELTAHVAEAISADFQQRAARMLPLRQADVDAAKAKAKALIKSCVQALRDQHTRATVRTNKETIFLDKLVLAGALRAAIDARRNS